MTSTTELPARPPCPGCGTRMDAASAIEDGKAPTLGAISICWSCSHVAFFAEDLSLRTPSSEEFADLDEETRRRVDIMRAAVLRRQQHRAVEKRLLLSDDFERMRGPLACGDAALIGPKTSAGPPPRKWRPTIERRCSKCRARIWLSRAAPPSAQAMCVECAAVVLQELTRGAT